MEKMTSETFYMFRYVSDPRLSPDGSKIAFAVKRVSPAVNGYSTDLYVHENGCSRKVTQGGDAGAFVWYDNDTIFFAAPRDARDAKRIQGGEALTVYNRLTLSSGEVEKAFELPVSSAQLTYLGQDQFVVLGKYDNNVLQPGEEKGAVTTLSEIPYWGEFGLGYTSKLRNRLYLYDLAKDQMDPITAPLFEVVKFQCADGKVAILGMEYDAKATRLYGLFCYNVAQKKLTELIPQNTMHIFGCAPFGDEVMFMGNTSTPYEHDRENNNFYHMPATGGQFQLIMEYDHNIGGGNGTTDAKMGGGQTFKRLGDRLYLLSTRVDSIGLFSIDLKGDWREEDYKQGLILGFDRCGDRTVMCAMYGEKLPELYENGEQITHFNDQVTDQLTLSKPIYEEVRTSDGLDIHGWVMKPTDYEEGKTYPAILHIHGGPPTIFSDVLHCEHQLWANNGYFVIFCNPRGSDGRGFDFRNLTGKYGDWDYVSLMDYLDGILERYPQIDVKRLGVTGGSYGGYMTNWIIGHTDRFAAAVSQRSISDWVTFEYTAIRGWYHSVYKHGTRAGEHPEVLWDCSPLKYAERATTPTLFIHSDNDHVCWLSEGLTMFAALKTAGCPSKICIFHGENHELSRSGKPRNRIRRMNEILGWFDSYLKKEK